jgi:hypothetical protein
MQAISDATLYMYNRVGRGVGSSFYISLLLSLAWRVCMHCQGSKQGPETITCGIRGQTFRYVIVSPQEAYCFGSCISSCIRMAVKQNTNRKRCTEIAIQAPPRISTSYFPATPRGARGLSVLLTYLHSRLLDQLPIRHKTRDLINTLNTNFAQQL